MKSQKIVPSRPQVKEVKHMVIKGSQNIPYDANVMAQIQQQKSYLEQLAKKNKMESFLNQTRLNASKLYKEKFQKNNEKQNSKKAILQKQKDLKSKYTMVKKTDTSKLQNQLKKGESVKNIKVQPTKVEWRMGSQTNLQTVNIPEQKLNYEDGSDDQLSAIDSDVDYQKEADPKNMLKFRENVRNAMLNKLSSKK